MVRQHLARGVANLDAAMRACGLHATGSVPVNQPISGSVPVHLKSNGKHTIGSNVSAWECTCYWDRVLGMRG